MDSTSKKQRRPKVLHDLDQSLNTSRFPELPWALFLIFYTPIGLVLSLLRACMSLQAILLLLVFPEGTLKRFLLRIFFGVLGIVVITEGFRRKSSSARVFVSNRLSYVDHIVLHLAFDCVTVSTGGKSPPLSPLFAHHVFASRDDDSLQSEARRLPEFDEHESLVDFTPFAIQPECTPTNGTHLLLQFSAWPFALDPEVQPVAISAFRPPGIKITKVNTLWWSDLFWTLFTPCTIFHVKLLPSMEREPQEMPQEFGRRVQEALASELGLQGSEVTLVEIDRWIKEPSLPPPPHKPATSQGPIIPPSDFVPSTSTSTSTSTSPEVEAMVQQVTAVLPQVPHTTIRSDLLKTHSVDITITNLLEGRVKYEPILTLQETVTATTPTATPPRPSSTGSRKAAPPMPSFRGMSSALSSIQRQLSLEERKRNLLEQARRHYIAKHGPRPI